jgi:hypothetical protein
MGASFARQGIAAIRLMRGDVRILRVLVTLALLPCAAAARLDGQAEHIHPAPAPDPPAWSWSWDARAFAGWNYQRRKFRDFQELESQNWIMGSGQRQLGGGRVRLTGMTSFEPFTIQPLGSPQVFQTGETFQQAPLIDYQHPHELFMAFGLAYERNIHRARAFVHADVVGSPALGPPAFMHRPSAAETPTAPLSHHMADATHITPGVVTAGVETGALTLAGSWFRGLEPDENRKDIDLGRLDSWSVQGKWRRKGWEAQASGAHLTTPEWVEPFFDVTRLSASLAFTQPDGRLAVLAAWGQNREVHGILDGYLLEATVRPHRRMAYYLRAEVVTKDILGAGGRHPLGFTHFHPLSKVGALTGGHVFDLSRSRAGTIGVGGDVTVYSVPANLKDSYGTPLSFHLFLRYRPNTASTHSMH